MVKLQKKFEEEEELQFYTKAKIQPRPNTCHYKKWYDHDPEKLQKKLDEITETTETVQEQIIEEEETG